MKPSTKALLAVLAVALPALFNFFAAKVASDEAKIRAEVAYVTMQESVKELQEASYAQALQVAKLEGQAHCGSLTPPPAPRVVPPKKVTPPSPPATGAAPPVKEPEVLMSVAPDKVNFNEAPPAPPEQVFMVYPDGGDVEVVPTQSQRFRPRDFESAVKEYKAKK